MVMTAKMKNVVVFGVVGIKDGKFFDVPADPNTEPWFLAVAACPIGVLIPFIITKGNDEYYETESGSDKIIGIKKFTVTERSAVQEAIKKYVGELTNVV